MRIRSVQLVAVCAAALLTACAVTPPRDHRALSGDAQLFEGMGRHGREIATASPEAQRFFDQGIAWMYAFNHDEAIRSFARAAELDPAAPMPWWGIAVCEGPNYNDPVMTDLRSASAWAALQEARARLDAAGPVERELVEALGARYAKPWPSDRSHLEQAYADAMAALWKAHPEDSDIGTLYAEAMMVQRPWMLYSAEGEPEGDTPQIVATLERVLELDPGNPGANHLYIHAIEPSKTPERAVAAADRLRDQVPGAGHLDHMPSHIYVQTGQWDESIASNARAMRADARYRELQSEPGIQNMYMVHNSHMLAFSAMMAGREEEAMAAARSMWADLPEGALEEAGAFVDLWMTSVYDVQKRFGRWQELLDEPGPPADLLPITNAVWHAHRAIAHAALHDFAAAEREQRLFVQAKAAIPGESVFGGDPSEKILAVSEHFVAGEIALQRKDWVRAVRELEKAVAFEDELSYGEPPQWLQPTRHTLGAVYMSAGRFPDAERVYREDLAKWKNNGWSLYGLSRALHAQGRLGEAGEVEALFDSAWEQADEPTTTSCKCIANV